MKNFTIRTKIIAGVSALAVIIGCGGGTPYSPIVDTPTGTFGVSVSPTTRTIAPGGSTTYAVSTLVVEGQEPPSEVALDVRGLPEGATASFEGNTVGVPGTADLSVSTTSTLAPGSYPFTITGTAGEESHSTTATLVIEGLTGDFTIEISPDEASIGGIKAGYPSTSSIFPSAIFTITVTPVNNFAGTVDLSVDTLNEVAGTPFRAFFDPNAGINFEAGDGPKTRNLVVEQIGATSTRRHTFNVQGKSGALEHSDNAAVLANTSADFDLLGDSPRNVIPGGETTFTVSVSGADTGNVSLAVGQGAPNNTQVVILDNTVPAGGNTGVTMSTSPDTLPGDYNVTIQGTRNGFTRTTTLFLGVGAPFTVAITPPLQSLPNLGQIVDRITNGQQFPSVEYRVTVTPAGADFRGRVAISVSGLEAALDGGNRVLGSSLGFEEINFGDPNFNNKPLEFDCDVQLLRATNLTGDFPFTVKGTVVSTSGLANPFSANAGATVRLVNQIAAGFAK